jgi:biopolymer transport protein TolR
MGASLPKNTKTRSSRSRPIMSDINVTPFVDVMLVLLIIFMVTAPMMTVGISVDLPQTKAGPIDEKSEPLTISIDKEGLIYIQETVVSLDELVPRLKALTQDNDQAPIFIRGDQGISYGKVMDVMGSVNAAGFKKVALLAQLPTKSGIFPPPLPPVNSNKPSSTLTTKKG